MHKLKLRLFEAHRFEKSAHQIQYEHEQKLKAEKEIKDKQDDAEQILLNKLPHGSGINGKWEFEWLKNGNVKAKNSFHCMNDGGYYDGYAEFTVIIPPQDHTDFHLVFNGRQGQNKNRQYMLRDYLESTLYEALKDQTALFEALQDQSELRKEIKDGSNKA